MSKTKRGAQVSALALTLALMLSNCSMKKPTKEISFEDLLLIPEIANITVLDEELDSDEIRFNSDMNILDAADLLKKALDIIEKTKDYKNDGSRKYNSQLEWNVVNLVSVDEVQMLIEDAQTLPISKQKRINKELAENQLKIINHFFTEWVKKYGLIISVDIIKAAVKGSVAQGMNTAASFVYGGSTTGGTLTENMDNKSEGYYQENSSAEGTNYQFLGDPGLHDVVSYIYKIQASSIKEMDTIIKTCYKALGYAKGAIESGANIYNDAIGVQYTLEFANDNFINDK